MRIQFCVCLALLLAPLVQANTITLSSSPGAAIPDGSPVGVSDNIVVSTPITSITSVTLTLDIQGGIDGDYYAYLSDGSNFAVLLNRMGVTSVNSIGSLYSGLAVTFSDTAPNGDIHSAGSGGGTLTGTWQPDGRNVNPATALDTDPRTALLNLFDGTDPNGTWTLFVSDASKVGMGTFADWSLTINGNGPVTNIPDTGNGLVLLAIALLPLLAISRRCNSGRTLGGRTTARS